MIHQVIWPSTGTLVPRRVPGLPFKVSAIDVTRKVFFEFVLVSGQSPLSPESAVRVLPHPPCEQNVVTVCTMKKMWVGGYFTDIFHIVSIRKH